MISSKSRDLSRERTEGGPGVTPSPVQTGEGGWGQAGVAEKRHIFLPPPQPSLSPRRRDWFSVHLSIEA